MDVQLPHKAPPSSSFSFEGHPVTILFLASGKGRAWRNALREVLINPFGRISHPFCSHSLSKTHQCGCLQLQDGPENMVSTGNNFLMWNREHDYPPSAAVPAIQAGLLAPQFISNITKNTCVFSNSNTKTAALQLAMVLILNYEHA